MSNHDDEYEPEELPIDVDTGELFSCGQLTATEHAHVYKLEDGFYREPWDDVKHEGKFCTFDETDQFLNVYDTLEEAVEGITAYCRSLGAPD
jgi:hypothetical protein